MDNRFLGVLAVILMSSSTCPAAENSGGPYGVATITGEIRDPASREIGIRYTSSLRVGESPTNASLSTVLTILSSRCL